MSKEARFTYQRRGRYFLTAAPARQRYLAFVLHGYGQHPRYFLQPFEQIGREDILFVAPEGLHRFYVNHEKKRVGSSWMTAEDRETDMADYLRLLEQVSETVLSQMERPPVGTGLLGFSQGVATACRWATYRQQRFDHLINWAGAFPPDLDFSEAHRRLQHLPLHWVLGDADPYLPPERVEEQAALLRENAIRYQEHHYQGAHRLHRPTLQALYAQLWPAASAENPAPGQRRQS